MDISTLSLAEMKALLSQLPKEIENREKAEKAVARKELEAFAAERGFTLDELIGVAEGRKKEKVKVDVKFRHPTNPELVSSGRGRQARWITEFLANGGTLEQLTV